MKTFFKIFLIVFNSALFIIPQSELEKDFDILKYTLEVDFYNNYSEPFPHSFNGMLEIEFRALNDLNQIRLNATSFSLVINKIEGKDFSYKHSDRHIIYKFQ